MTTVFTFDVAFQAVNLFALVGWIFLMVLPRWKHTQQIVLVGVVLVLACAYATLFPASLSGTGNGMTLEGIGQAFGQPAIALLGWVHII
jgi:hypothetical protein